jgi:hypothetical protein
VSAQYGFEAHSGSSDHDDGSDEFIIEKYRSQIESESPPPQISLSSLDQAIISRFEAIAASHRISDDERNPPRRAPEDDALPAEDRQESDNPTKLDDTDPMNDLNRDELRAHLENQSLKVDSRLQSFEQTVKDAMGEIRLEMSGMRGDMKAVEADLGHLKDLRSSMRNTTLAIVGAIVASTLTIFFGVQSSNSSLVSSTIAGFGVGKDISSAQATMAQQTKETQALLLQIQEQQKKLQAAPPPEQK